jgi:hypothetical protein
MWMEYASHCQNKFSIVLPNQYTVIDLAMCVMIHTISPRNCDSVQATGEKLIFCEFFRYIPKNYQKTAHNSTSIIFFVCEKEKKGFSFSCLKLCLLDWKRSLTLVIARHRH